MDAPDDAIAEPAVESKARRRPRSPKGRARVAHELLSVEYPDARCELDHDNAFQLLAATILSAQCTDERVNMVTPELFRRWPTPEDLASADPGELEVVIHSTGFFRSKTKNLIGMADRLVEAYGGEVPAKRSDLVTLPGVGRKTANVVRSVALGLPGLPVDTHVLRLSGRLELTEETDPVKVELELNPDGPGVRAGALQPSADPAWSTCVSGPHATLWRLHAGLVLPERRSVSLCEPVCAAVSVGGVRGDGFHISSPRVPFRG